jgi:YVTN family beta-propeller protein
VVNGGDDTVSVIDVARNEVAGTIQLKNARFPHHLYLNADGSRMLLAAPGVDLSLSHGGGHEGHGGAVGAVLLLNAATGKTLVSRNLPTTNHNAVFAPNGQEIWTSQMSDPGVALVLDGSTLETLETIEVGSGPAEVTFSADGTKAFVANGASASVTVIDTGSKKQLATVDVGEGPVGAWQGSNGLAYVDNEPAESISVIDTASLEVLFTYDLGFMPGMPAFGPDDRLWVTDAEHGKVVLFDAMSDQRLGEIEAGAGAHAIAFDSAGKTAYVSNQMDDSVSVIDIASEAVVKRIVVGAKPNGLVWRSQ